MKDATEIVVVMDKSGSMGPMRSDVIGGFNQFLREQKELPGEANLTLVQFDTTYSIPYAGKPIKDVELLDKNTYRTGGGTALNDALAKAITETGHRLKNMNESDRPDKVLCVVVTDGEENSSKEHTKSQVKEMVDHQRVKYDWAFLYLGANVDAFAEASQLGISGDAVANVSAGSIGTRSAYAATSAAAESYRGGKGLGPNWKTRIK